MLDGLEAVEITFSYVLNDNDSFRFDPEYFKKDFISVDKYLTQFKYLSEISNTYELHSNGSFASVFDILHDNEEAVINYIRSTNVGNFFINGEMDKISLSAHNKLIKTKTLEGDILTARTGKVGGASIITKDFVGSNSNQNVVNIRIIDKSIIPLFLVSFLNCKYGINQFIQASTGNVQPWLNLSLLRKVKIPVFSNNYQLKIEEVVKLSYQKLEDSKLLHTEAEDLLLKELDLLDFEPSQEQVSIKSFSESFGDSGRLDSEYYQSKYDEIIEKIKSYRGGFEFLNIVCNLKDKNYKLQDKEYYQYVELSNIGTTGDIIGFTYEQGQELPSRARRLINENDVIISSIEGSLEKIAIVRKEFNNSLCSTGFYVVDSDKINSETLLVLFKNKIMQQILKQKCSGTILTGMNKDDFLDIVIPIIDDTIQTQIEEKIKKSFKLKEESKQLLEVAKRAVEIAIEKNEDIAIEFIDENRY